MTVNSVLDQLNRLVDDIKSLNSKLILLIGPPRSGKSQLLSALSDQRQLSVLNIGSSLGRHLVAIPNSQRHIEAATALTDLATHHSSDGLLLIDNIEFLFDQSLRLDPLDLLKRSGRTRVVVSAWPGVFDNNRLTYATIGHPERQDYAVDGLVPFEMI